MDTILLLIVIGLLAGIVGGMAGIGGGLIIVPALVFFLGFSQHEAQGTSTATLLFPIGILAAYNYYKAEAVNWRYALIIASAFIVGSYLGSKFALNIDGKTLKRSFAILLIVSAAKLLYDSYKSS